MDDYDHDRCLLQVLNGCRQVGLKLNATKCIFKATQVVFCGHLVHTDGLSPDPRKGQAISNMPIPSNKTELQSYSGMCNFLSSYVPHLADKLYMLKKLMAKNSAFIWTASHSKAFKSSKKLYSLVQHSCTLMIPNPVLSRWMLAMLVLVQH